MPTRSELDAIVIKAAERFRLDANLIRAIVFVESSWRPDAKRFEPAWNYFLEPRTFAERLEILAAYELEEQATSWGLMQIMGSVAREYGFTERLRLLATPEIGVFYGCKHLRTFFDKYGDEEKVVAAYNAGSPRYTKGGMFENQRYVDKVFTELRRIRSLI